MNRHGLVPGSCECCAGNGVQRAPHRLAYISRIVLGVSSSTHNVFGLPYTSCVNRASAEAYVRRVRVDMSDGDGTCADSGPWWTCTVW